MEFNKIRVKPYCKMMGVSLKMEKLLELVKLPVKTILALSVATGLILFLPNNIIHKLYIDNLKEKYGFIIGIVFIISISIVFINIIIYIFNTIKEKISILKLKFYRKKILKSLDESEKNVLLEFMNSANKTVRLPIHSGTTIKLQNYKIISPAGNNHIVDARYMEIPYFIQPWAYEYLNKHKNLLE